MSRAGIGDSQVEILLVTGPAGIGKSTLCWETGGRD